MRDSLDPQGLQGLPVSSSSIKFRFDSFTGQFWNLKEDGDAIRLTTNFRDPMMCLDIFNGGSKQ